MIKIPLTKPFYAYQLQEELNNAGIISAVWDVGDPFVQIYSTEADKLKTAEQILAKHTPKKPALLEQPASVLSQYNDKPLEKLTTVDFAILLNQLALAKLDITKYLNNDNILENLP